MRIPDKPRSRGRAFILAALLGGAFHLVAQAQSTPVQSTPPVSSEATPGATISAQESPSADGHGESTDDQRTDGSIHGTVEDSNGNAIAGARVSLALDLAKAQDTMLTDTTGYFNFPGLKPGGYRVKITSQGFADWTATEIDLPPGKNYELPPIMLRIASTNADVEVVATPHEVAEEQMREEEKQRLIGVFPNFYVTYIWKAVPLSSGQKFRLALRTSVDPVTFLLAGATAGIEQWQDSFSGYGQGGDGYAKRLGASYADSFTATILGGAVFPSILHQDPRYFYKGTGSISSRALYAISTAVICRGDNGRWQPNYSNLLGNLASAGISNLYYPASNRDGAGVTIDNALINTAEGAAGALLQEFIFKKFTRGIQRIPVPQPSPSKQTAPQ